MESIFDRVLCQLWARTTTRVHKYTFGHKPETTMVYTCIGRHVQYGYYKS